MSYYPAAGRGTRALLMQAFGVSNYGQKQTNEKCPLDAPLNSNYLV
ncbi:MAG: hypothetical protein ACI4ET_04145 [Bilifractor sp.]